MAASLIDAPSLLALPHKKTAATQANHSEQGAILALDTVIRLVAIVLLSRFSHSLGIISICSK